MNCTRGRFVRLAGVLVGVGAATGPAVASAAGFATQHFGGEQGSVVSTNPTALYYNPAGIGFSKNRLDLYLDGELALRQAAFNHPRAASDPPDPMGGEGANAGYAHLFNVFGAPALGGTLRIHDLALGAGLFVPFGGQETWDRNAPFARSQFPLAADGPQRWHSISGQLAFIYGTVGAAYRIGPLSIGASGNVVYSSVQLSRAVIPPFGDPDTANEGRAKLDVTGVTASFGVGLMFEAVPDTLWLAASYQSQPGLGPQTLTGTLDLATPYTMPPLTQTRNVNFTQALPDVVRVGARWRARKDVELRLYGDYTRWSVLRTQCLSQQPSPCSVVPDGSPAPGSLVLLNLRRLWNDTYHGHLGASYWIDPDVELFAGAGLDTAATPDATVEPTLADSTILEAAIGGRLLVANWAYVSITYTSLNFLDRDNAGRSQLANAQLPTRQQDAGGQYTQHVDVLDLSLEKTF